MSMPSMEPFLILNVLIVAPVLIYALVMVSRKWGALQRGMRSLWVCAFLWPFLDSLVLSSVRIFQFGVTIAVLNIPVIALSIYLLPILQPLSIEWLILLVVLLIATSKYFPDKNLEDCSNSLARAERRAEVKFAAQNFPSLQPLDDLFEIRKKMRKEAGLE